MLDPYYDRAAGNWGCLGREPCDNSPKSRDSDWLPPTGRLRCSIPRSPRWRSRVRWTAVTDESINRQGIRQRGCTGCGDCTSGCNVGAKNAAGDELLATGTSERRGDVHAHRSGSSSKRRTDTIACTSRTSFRSATEETKTVCGSVTSRIVILGAGSIGSNEIMLRSRGCGMELSDRVGFQWTMNGDALGFMHRADT